MVAEQQAIIFRLPIANLLASGSELASALIGEAVYQARSAVLLLSLLGNRCPDYSGPYQILHGYLK